MPNAYLDSWISTAAIRLSYFTAGALLPTLFNLRGWWRYLRGDSLFSATLFALWARQSWFVVLPFPLLAVVAWLDSPTLSPLPGGASDVQLKAQWFLVGLLVHSFLVYFRRRVAVRVQLPTGEPSPLVVYFNRADALDIEVHMSLSLRTWLRAVDVSARHFRYALATALTADRINEMKESGVGRVVIASVWFEARPQRLARLAALLQNVAPSGSRIHPIVMPMGRFEVLVLRLLQRWPGRLLMRVGVFRRRLRVWRSFGHKVPPTPFWSRPRMPGLALLL